MLQEHKTADSAELKEFAEAIANLPRDDRQKVQGFALGLLTARRTESSRETDNSDPA